MSSDKKGLCVVTGAGGFLGSHLCEYLVSKGNTVVGISRTNRFLDEKLLSHPRFYFIEQDLCLVSPEQLLEIGSTVDVIFHLASQQPSFPDLQYEDFYQGNVVTTLKIIDLANKLSVKTVIYTSTITVFGYAEDVLKEDSCVSPPNYYGLTKYIAEKLLEFYSKDSKRERKAIVFRLPSVFGNNHLGGIVHTICSLAKQNKEIEVFSKVERIKTLISDKTVVEALYLGWQKSLSLFRNFELFLIADEPAIRLIDIAKLVVETMDSHSKIVLSDKKVGLDWDIIVDVTKAKEVLGFRPRNLVTALKDYVREVWM